MNSGACENIEWVKVIVVLSIRKHIWQLFPVNEILFLPSSLSRPNPNGEL